MCSLCFRTEFVLYRWCLSRGKLECVLYIVSNRNVGKRYVSPILIQNFTLFQPNDNFPSLIFLYLNRFPLWRRCLLFTNDSFGCGWTFVFAVNRSELVRLCWKRSVVSVCVCAQARGRVELCPCVTTNVGMLFGFFKVAQRSRFVWFNRVTFRRIVQNWPLHF